MSRLAITIAACIALGAVTTVAAAWASAAWIESAMRWESSRPIDFAGVWRWNMSRGEWFGKTDYQTSWSSAPLRMSIRSISLSPIRSPAELAPPWTDFLESGATTPPGELHRRAVHASGWPCLSMWWGEAVHSDYGEPWLSAEVRVVDEETRYGITLDDSRALPLAIITRGFAIDTLVFSVSWFVLVLTPFRIRRTLRRYERGLCPRCVFALRGDYTTVCPECGWQRNGAEHL